MPDTPADTLRAAAQLLRGIDFHPTTIPDRPPVASETMAEPLARLLIAASDDFARVEGRARALPHHLADYALAVARAVLEADR